MKLSKEKTTVELKKLSDYFIKIEKLASNLGIDMDDIMNEFKNNNTARYNTFKEKLLSKAGERAATYKKAKSDPSEEAWVEKK
jgi:hypothetical protein